MPTHMDPVCYDHSIMGRLGRARRVKELGEGVSLGISVSLGWGGGWQRIVSVGKGACRQRLIWRGKTGPRAHVGVGLRAWLRGRGTSRQPVLPGPSQSLSPRQGLHAFRETKGH